MGTPHKLRILIVDDHPLFSEALACIVQNLVPGAEVLSASNLMVAQQLQTAHGEPHWVFLDLGLPDSAAQSSLQHVSGTFGSAMVVVCSAHDDPLRVEQALSLGAVGFISKAERPAVILERIRDLLDGQSAATQTPRTRSTRDCAAQLPLSGRQHEVMQAMSRGLSNKDIARELGLSPETVKVHLREIFLRLGARTRTEAVAIYSGNEPIRNPAVG